MIGASGPSISMMALSTPRPHSAAITCSMVEHARAGIVVAQNGREFGGGDGAGVRADFALRPALRIEPDEHDAGAGIGRM